jgi:hypothetical protein
MFPDSNLDAEYLESYIVSPPDAIISHSPPLFTSQVSLLLSNPHYRIASPPSTTYSGVGFDISPEAEMQWTS